jgi:hypothetical protein
MPNLLNLGWATLFPRGEPDRGILPSSFYRVNTHLPCRRAALKKGAASLVAAAIYLLAGAGTAAAGPETAQALFSHDLGGSDATLSLSGGTLSRGGRVTEIFAPLHVTTKSLRDFGAAAQEGGFSLYERVFRALDNEWLGFTFSITALPETTTLVALSALMVIMFLWPDRRRLVKDFKSVVGLRPPGRVRIEAYRRRANDDGLPRQQVWAEVEQPKVPPVVAVKTRDHDQAEPLSTREPMLAA